MMNFCNHRKHTLSDKDIRKLKPINVNQGGIFRSIVKTTIDIADYGESKDIDIILLGAYLHYWDKYFDEESDLYDEEIIEDVVYYLDMLEKYSSERDRRKAVRRGINPEVFEEGEKIKKDVDNLKEEYDFSYSELNDYFILKKRFSEDEENQKDEDHIDERREIRLVVPRRLGPQVQHDRPPSGSPSPAASRHCGASRPSGALPRGSGDSGQEAPSAVPPPRGMSPG